LAKPLIVNVVELLRWPGSKKEVSATIDVVDFEFGDPRVVDSPIAIEIRLESLSTSVEVVGTASLSWAGDCRRCLAPVISDLVVDFDEMYQREIIDPDAYAIENDQINLLPMVRENILLAIPIGPLCREDCPGFCPHCGLDLSISTCNCDNSVSDPRWAGLESLKGILPDDSE
jgi:uncharacterized protein